jgi:SAM-dependent methyltransferase
MSCASPDWQWIDRQREPWRYVAYIDESERTSQHERIRAALLRVAGPAGAAVDVGCGLGRAVDQLVAHGWRVTGVDRNRTMVEEARRRYPSHDFRVASAFALPFADRTLDLYRAERLLIHLPPEHGERAIAEARRVLRPGGRIALAEADFGTLTLSCDDAHRATADAARDALAGRLASPHAGSELRGRLVAAGFEQVAVSGHVELFDEPRLALPIVLDGALATALEAGRVTVEEADALRADVRERARRGAFQLSLTMFVISATAP